MDVNGAANLIPDSWASRLLDGLGAVLLMIMKNTHGRFEKRMEDMDALKSEHEVMKNRIANIESDITEIKSDGKETLRILLQRKNDWRH